MSEIFLHHLYHLLIYCVTSTVVIVQISFAVWLLLKWLKKNVKLNWSPVLNIGESSSKRRVEGSPIETIKGDMGPVEVDVKKNIFLSDADESTVQIDEKVKGKVKTQKNKLKKLRGK